MWELGDILNDRCAFVKLYPQKMIFDPQNGVEPVTFWWPERHCHHSATETQYMSHHNINISWLPLRSPIYRTCTLAHHLSLGSSMVRASQRSSEGRGFDPHLGLRNERSAIIQDCRYSWLPIIQTFGVSRKRFELSGVRVIGRWHQKVGNEGIKLCFVYILVRFI